LYCSPGVIEIEKNEIGRLYSIKHGGKKRKVNFSHKETDSLVDVDTDGTVIQQLF